MPPFRHLGKARVRIAQESKMLRSLSPFRCTDLNAVSMTGRFTDVHVRGRTYSLTIYSTLDCRSDNWEGKD